MPCCRSLWAMRSPRRLAVGPPRHWAATRRRASGWSSLEADEPAQKLSVDPFHSDYRVPISTDVDSALDVLEVDEGWREDIEQIAAQFAVAGLLVTHFAGEASDGEGTVCHGHRIYACESPGEDEWHGALWLSDTCPGSSSVPLKHSRGFWTASL